MAILILAGDFAWNYTRRDISCNRAGGRRRISVRFGGARGGRRDQFTNAVDHFYWCNKAVAQPWKRFDVARSERRIAKGGANFFHGGVEAVFKIDKRLRR